MAATLAEELLRIAYDDTGRAKPGGSIELDCGMAGAVLEELSLAGSIDVVGGLVSVLDPAPLGDPDSDAALERIAGAEKARKPDWWVSRLRFGIRNRMLARLVDSGALRMERRDVLWLFSSRRYFSVQAGVRSAISTQLERVVVHGGEPDARTAALASLLNASGLARRTFPELDRRQLKTRMTELSEGRWVGAAVRKAIQSIQSSS
jgi:hypothetical protein